MGRADVSPFEITSPRPDCIPSHINLLRPLFFAYTLFAWYDHYLAILAAANSHMDRRAVPPVPHSCLFPWSLRSPYAPPHLCLRLLWAPATGHRHLLPLLPIAWQNDCGLALTYKKYLQLDTFPPLFPTTWSYLPSFVPAQLVSWQRRGKRKAFRLAHVLFVVEQEAPQEWDDNWFRSSQMNWPRRVWDSHQDVPMLSAPCWGKRDCSENQSVDWPPQR